MPGHQIDFQPFPSVMPSGAPGNDYEHIEARPEMFGGLLARGTQTLGQGIEHAGEAGLDYLTERNTLNNQIHASELHSDFSDKATDLVTKYSQLQGRSALDALPQFKSDLADLQKQAEGQAGSLQTRQMVSQNTRRSMDWFYGIATRHADTQHTKWATETAHDNITSAIGVGGLAVVNTDFGKLDQQMNQIDAEAHNYYDPQGYDKDTLATQVSKYRGQALKNWVETAATNDKDPDGITHALQVYHRYQDTIDPDNRLTISKWLNAKSTARTVDQLSKFYSTPLNRTVRTDLSPQMRGLLDTIAGGETLHGGYNELYTGKDVQEVKPGFDYSDHPRVMFPAQYGPTSAFGRYQITKTTWDEDKDRFGLSDITPESQDLWAAKKASELYGRQYKGPAFGGFSDLTGNLEDDLKTHSRDPQFLAAVGKAVSHEWTSAPGGLQPNAATGSWTARFQKAIAVNENEGDQAHAPDAAEIATRISRDPLLATRPELQKAVMQNALSKIAIQEHAQALAAKQSKDQSDGAEITIFGRIHSQDPSKLPSLDEILANPLMNREAKERMATQLIAVKGTEKPEHTYGPAFYDMYRRVHAAPDDPQRITDPGELYGHVGPNGDLTVAGVDKLASEIQGRKTPEGFAEGEMKLQFLKNARAQITGTDEGLHIRDPKGDQLYQKFMTQALPAYEAARKQGKSAADLLNPDSPSYVGKSIATFRRPMDQWFSDMVHDQPAGSAAGTAPGHPAAAAPFDPKSVKSLDETVRLYRSGQITKQQADALAIERGWGFRKPPAEQPQVPMNR
jgi:muramidase (phage lysozyme)